MFLIDEVELAIKRSALDRNLDNYQKTISFLSIVNSALGHVNVNFDAETPREELPTKEFGKIYDFGKSWSETYQASAFHDGQPLLEKASELSLLLGEFGKRFSANLVIGNGAYGFRPEFSMLRELALKLYGSSKTPLKLGVEGRKYGRLAIELASKINSIAYVLHTSSLDELLLCANSYHVNSTVYALCRIAKEGKGRAAAHLTRIKGASYFERRGIMKGAIFSRLNEFALFGKKEEIALQIRKLIDQKMASKVAIYPVFSDLNDLIEQMKMLSQIISDA